MKRITCYKCGRLLCKMDNDGTIHIKSREGTEVIARATNGKILLICPAVRERGQDSEVKCAGVRVIEYEEDKCLV